MSEGSGLSRRREAGRRSPETGPSNAIRPERAERRRPWSEGCRLARVSARRRTLQPRAARSSLARPVRVVLLALGLGFAAGDVAVLREPRSADGDVGAPRGGGARAAGGPRGAAFAARHRAGVRSSDAPRTSHAMTSALAVCSLALRGHASPAGHPRCPPPLVATASGTSRRCSSPPSCRPRSRARSTGTTAVARRARAGRAAARSRRSSARRGRACAPARARCRARSTAPAAGATSTATARRAARSHAPARAAPRSARRRRRAPPRAASPAR